MPTEPKKHRGKAPQASDAPPPTVPQAPMIQTAEIASLYSNLASLSMSYNDIRVYLMEISPKEISPVSVAGRTVDANVQPKLCLVLTPEFARSLRDALSSTIANYEKAFGPLRSAPGIGALLKALPKQ
jgi:hypothetical protein